MRELPLHRLSVSLSVNLPPAAAEDVDRGLRNELDGMLLKHSHDFGGVLLAYEKEEVLSRKAVIGPYFPYFNVKARAILTVFQPKVGDTVVGKVNQVGSDYIGLLVLGVLNASISSAHMGSRFSFKGGEWRRNGDSGDSIQEGCEVRFTVQSKHEQGEFFSISGSLAEEGTGAIAPRGDAKAEEPEAGAAAEDDGSTYDNGANPFAPPVKAAAEKQEEKADEPEENGAVKGEKKSKSEEKKKKKKKKGAEDPADEKEAKKQKKEGKEKKAKKQEKEDKADAAEEEKKEKKKKKKKDKQEAAADEGGKPTKKAKKDKKK